MTLQRFDHFQIIRGVASIMVVWSHIWGPLLGDLSAPAWLVPVVEPVGFLWVWLFLALSGFLLAKAFVTDRFSLDTQGITRFYVAREAIAASALVCIAALDRASQNRTLADGMVCRPPDA